jgi:saccharopine dehydrogenase-like NADP-dependent oxidoreductase
MAAVSDSHRHRVLILGAGRVGSLIAALLSVSGRYQLHLAGRSHDKADRLIGDLQLANVTAHEVDATDSDQLARLMTQLPFDAVVSALPYHLNPGVVDLAARHAINYFDLTEDVAVTRYIRDVSGAADTVFMPQCGLAPGFINIVANELMGSFETLDTVKLRVGALPQHTSNSLKYALTWSTEGLINECLNSCEGIEHGQPATLQPMEGLESLILEGCAYEAFNTSGGLGTLAETYAGRVQTMNYKSIRYPGHRQALKLLLQDLKFENDRDGLKTVLENAIPTTLQDLVLVCVFVSGRRGADFVEESYFRKIYPREIAGRTWSAIQLATAAGLCGAVDVVLADPGSYRGFVSQESISLTQFMNTEFGEYYA